MFAAAGDVLEIVTTVVKAVTLAFAEDSCAHRPERVAGNSRTGPNKQHLMPALLCNERAKLASSISIVLRKCSQLPLNRAEENQNQYEKPVISCHLSSALNHELCP